MVELTDTFFFQARPFCSSVVECFEPLGSALGTLKPAGVGSGLGGRLPKNETGLLFAPPFPFVWA